jgi:hypothetical protein
MTRDEWMTMFRNFPEEEHNKLVLVLQNNAEISIDTVFRFEQYFLVVRGRTGGTIDEARGFFIPYEQMIYVRFERIMKLEELEAMFKKAEEAIVAPPPVTETPAPQTTTPLNLPRPALPAPTDPTAASRLLLERIRATRTLTATRTSNPVSRME